MTRNILAASWAALLMACASPAPRAPAVDAVSSSQVEAGAPPPGPADDPRCNDPSAAEAIVVKAGDTARTPLGIAVTYEGSEHDQYDDGGFDFIARLVFQGVMDDGSLTPSALSWRPSLVAPPRWVHLSMSLCVRLVEGGDDALTLELYRAPKGG